MYRDTYLTFAIGVLFALVQDGQALQCWKCSSSQDVTCRDNFNITKIEINKRYFESVNYGNRQIQPSTEPHVENCDEMYVTPGYNHKNACLKVVYKGVHGLNEVFRGCRLIQKSHSSRSCPEDLIDKSRQLEFCEICESDKCNDAGAVRINLFLTAVPTVMAILLRK